MSIESAARRPVPVIMLGQAAVGLLRDVFDSRELLGSSHRIVRRAVLWGKDTEPVVVDHAGIVTSETDLLAGLPHTPAGAGAGACNWQIYSSAPMPDNATVRHFGNRIASAARTVLSEAADRHTAYVESLREGWLFLLPDGDASGWLIAVGAEMPALLEASRFVAKPLTSVEAVTGTFPTHQRILEPLCREATDGAWIACGTAGIGFDPICGDGTANAVRESVLACAVVRAAAAGEPVADLLAHYQTRMILGFRRHIETSLEFYRGGYGGAWWDEQCDALRDGLAWCDAYLKQAAPPRYRLNGFDLERLPASSAQ